MATVNGTWTIAPGAVGILVTANVVPNLTFPYASWLTRLFCYGVLNSAAPVQRAPISYEIQLSNPTSPIHATLNNDATIGGGVTETPLVAFVGAGVGAIAEKRYSPGEIRLTPNVGYVLSLFMRDNFAATDTVLMWWEVEYQKASQRLF